MVNSKTRALLCMLILFVFAGVAYARMVCEDTPSPKMLDWLKVHNVGNIWLRVSNFGFFGSGNNNPQFPSLEYPGGSGIDYLYQASLWFGAKRRRRDDQGRLLYWLEDPQEPGDVVHADHPDWDPSLKPAIDTLTSVGFDGDRSLYEFLPAYNPLEAGAAGVPYEEYNLHDKIMTQSIRTQQAGVDNDGDGLIDEDPVGYAFPMRQADELPEVFASFGGKYLHELDVHAEVPLIEEYSHIWFPLGFMDLSQTPADHYCFTMPHDDDGDGLVDEDGAPVSEQDYISYYYDYSPFGTPGMRHWGSWTSGNRHHPLNVKVRQMSYQWSYEYIKNLVYVEFNITNMNPQDTLFDCAMGIYMDCDIGPQALGWQEMSQNDLSSYVPGEGYEFAYSWDVEYLQTGLAGYIGARVCTPDPEQLDYACWTWSVGEGPDDFTPRDPTKRPTANEKYWLLTGRNPSDYMNLREEPDAQMLEHPTGTDTRFLFAFFGDQQGMTDPTDASWNLAPGRTMKIVVAVFPGDTLEELRRTSRWAKDIYGEAQTLTTVILPDTFPHYEAPGPPPIPNMHAELVDDGNAIDVYWDNRSQKAHTNPYIIRDYGWQSDDPKLDSHISNYDENIFPDDVPGWTFAPEYDNGVLVENENAVVNPWTAYRLQHDFQGYSLWGRSGSGVDEHWMLYDRWDKKETEQDMEDYVVNAGHTEFIDFGGNLGIDKGLPQPRVVTEDTYEEDSKYYRYDEGYIMVNYELGDDIYGQPIYNHEVVYSDSLQQYAHSLSHDDQALLFKHADMRDDIYLNLMDERVIPLEGFLGQTAPWDPTGEALEHQRKDRLTRRYYYANIPNPPKGIEYYVSVSAWNRGIPDRDLRSLESGRDGNMQVFFPGPSAKSEMDNIYVVPNPYIRRSTFDGKRERDETGDKSRRIWFVNVPERSDIRIFTLAGDLVDIIHHDGAYQEDIINISKAAYEGLTASGIASWDLISMNNQIIAPGVYLFSVEDKATGDLKVGKFVIIK